MALGGWDKVMPLLVHWSFCCRVWTLLLWNIPGRQLWGCCHIPHSWVDPWWGPLIHIGRDLLWCGCWIIGEGLSFKGCWFSTPGSRGTLVCTVQRRFIVVVLHSVDWWGSTCWQYLGVLLLESYEVPSVLFVFSLGYLRGKFCWPWGFVKWKEKVGGEYK